MLIPPGITALDILEVFIDGLVRDVGFTVEYLTHTLVISRRY